MKSIAGELGISRTTVSLVLKGEAQRYRISRQTQQKITARIKELGYKPNYFARSLSVRRTRTVGLVIPNIFDSFITGIIKGIEDVLYEADYMLMLCTSRFDRSMEQRTIEQLRYRRVDGYILLVNTPYRNTPYDYSHIEDLIRHERNVVFVDRCFPQFKTPSVVFDDEKGAYLATRRLLKTCSRVGFIGLDLDVSTINNRYAGYIRALSGKKPDTDHVIRIGSDRKKELFSSLEKVMTGTSRPEGFFIATNGLAFESLQCLRALGFELNRDIEIAKFGSDPVNHPSGMTCVEQPYIEMGRRAARLVLEMIDSSRRVSKRQIVLKPLLRTS